MRTLRASVRLPDSGRLFMSTARAELGAASPLSRTARLSQKGMEFLGKLLASQNSATASNGKTIVTCKHVTMRSDYHIEHDNVLAELRDPVGDIQMRRVGREVVQRGAILELGDQAEINCPRCRCRDRP